MIFDSYSFLKYMHKGKTKGEKILIKIKKFLLYNIKKIPRLACHRCFKKSN